MKVSVVIPVYNNEQYIVQCIESLQHQTYTDIEIILINDGSNQKCSKLVTHLAKKDERIVLLSQKKNAGTGTARNTGIEHATGEFIYFMDSDDYIPEQTLELLVSEIKDFPMIRGRLNRTHLTSRKAIILDGLNKVTMYTDKKYDLIKHSTVVNFLVRTDFIREHRLRFDEDVRKFVDLTFLIPALVSVDQVPYIREALYFKRLRNDPITNPSLMQESIEENIKDYLTIYCKFKSNLMYNESFRALDEHFLNYYRADIVVHMKDEKNIEPIFDYLSHAFLFLHPRALRTTNFIAKREIKAIASGNYKKFKRINRAHQFLREFKWGLKTKRRFSYFLHNRIFSLLPMKKNQIFIESFLGKSYSDSPKYIYKYMQEHYPTYKFIWCFDEKKEIPGNAKQVKRFSIPYFYQLARSKYWISNSRLPRLLKKREGHVYLQTWHGTPLKRLVFDMDDIHSADPNYKSNFYEQSRRWDYLSSPNAYSTEIFKRAFLFDKEMLEYGYPRNDLLVNKNRQGDIEQIKSSLGLPRDKKIVLYAPTWRDDEFFARGKYKFSLQLDLDMLQERLGDEYIVLLRTHYFIANALDISAYKGFVYDFSAHDDIAELYVVSDMLITDYSSVFFDYANLQRPILFFTYDIEKYRDQLRGFYIDMETELPGPLLYTSDEVIEAIERIDEVQEEYAEKYDTFYERFCAWDDGRSVQKTVEHVFGPPTDQ